MPFTINLFEIIDAVIIVLALGYIFKDFFKAPRKFTDPLEYYRKIKSGFNWNDFKFAALVTAPAVILHELGHKAVASAYGLVAVFNAAYVWLGIGVVLKLMGTGFIFFVPAYVRISSGATPIQHAIIAFAGPAVNLALFLIIFLLLKFNIVKNKKYHPALILTRRINLFLFIFNMLPIPGFDGFQIYTSLMAAF